VDDGAGAGAGAQRQGLGRIPDESWSQLRRSSTAATAAVAMQGPSRSEAPMLRRDATLRQRAALPQNLRWPPVTSCAATQHDLSGNAEIGFRAFSPTWAHPWDEERDGEHRRIGSELQGARTRGACG